LKGRPLVQNHAPGFEQRSAKRYGCAGSVWWIGQDGDAFRKGWMFDRSRSGIAFLTPTDCSPAATEKVSVCLNDPNEGFADCESLRVVRVASHGPAFNLVGCTRFP
jgi:hypothetical protein